MRDWKWRACSWARDRGGEWVRKREKAALMRHLITTSVRIPVFHHQLPFNLVRAPTCRFEWAARPPRHLQINEKCHIWFHSSSGGVWEVVGGGGRGGREGGGGSSASALTQTVFCCSSLSASSRSCFGVGRQVVLAGSVAFCFFLLG